MFFPTYRIEIRIRVFLLLAFVALTILVGQWPAAVTAADSAKQKPSHPATNQPVITADPNSSAAAGRLARVPKVPNNFVLLLTGNWAGHIEPCGCTDKQLGGIDRRTDTIQKIAPDRNARLMLDAGPIIEEQNRQSQLKFETFLYSLKQLNYDAITLSPHEIILLREKLAIDPNQRSPVICSNMPATVRKKFAVRQSLNKTLRLGEHQLDCLILALADPEKLSDERIVEKLLLTEPVQALKKVLTSQNIPPDKSCPDKLIIVLLSAVNESLVKKLQLIPAIDILVTRGTFDEPEHCPTNGPLPFVVTTGKMGKYIARIDVPFPPAKPDHNKHALFNFQPVEIDSKFTRDPAIVSFIDDYQEIMQWEDLIDGENALPRKPLPDDIPFAGNASCGAADCHEGIYKTWVSFGHAHAMETLRKVNRHFDPECVVCHTVGMEYEGGYRSVDQTPELANVGCEMCHGPGEYHNNNPQEPYQQIFTLCEDCHNHETSPSFENNRLEYLKNIQHWHEPRQYWP